MSLEQQNKKFSYGMTFIGIVGLILTLILILITN